MNRGKEVSLRAVLGILTVGLMFTPGIAGHAQEQAPAPDAPNHPNPNMRAARLSYVQGDVVLTQGNEIIADPGLVNTPLFEGTVVSTKDDGRAELQLDDGTIARLSPNSSLKIAALHQEGNTAKTNLVLESGLGYFELQGNTSSDEVSTQFGTAAVSASGFTVIRVDLDNPPGEVAVFTGNAHLERGASLSLDLHGGESVALNAADPNQYNVSENIEPDSWDAWNADRDQDLTSQEAARTVASGSQQNSSNPAWSDLDANGNWYDVPGQGYVWSPYEAASAGWDPYGCGNWVSTPQFGYSWVSCEPWGYLPYTSGYWNYYDGFGWGWMPGYGYPWWFTGGWGSNIGTRPPRYSPPHRPNGGPVHPVGPIRHGGYYEPHPVIAVNRNPVVPRSNPVHPVGRPITIAGSTVEPIKPLSPRPAYNHEASTAPGRALLGGSNIGAHTGYNPWANAPGTSRPGTWTMPAGGGYHSPSSGRYAGAGGTYHPSGSPYSGGVGRPSAPGGHVGGGVGHVSSGGGGHVSSGGGGHVSAGIGGGGGGGGHASSGGGSGHH